MSDVFFFKGKAYRRFPPWPAGHRPRDRRCYGVERSHAHDADAEEEYQRDMAQAASGRVQLFCAENDQHPVVSGQVLHWLSTGGARYELEGGVTWTLTRNECRQLPEGYPKWKLP